MFEGKYIVGKDDNFIISPAINTNMKEIEENLIMFSVRLFSEKKTYLAEQTIGNITLKYNHHRS